MIHFVLSSELFQGFTLNMHKEDISSMNDVIIWIKEALIIELQKLNLCNLVDKAKEMHLDYHDYDLTDVLSCDDKIFYICDHC